MSDGENAKVVSINLSVLEPWLYRAAIALIAVGVAWLAYVWLVPRLQSPATSLGTRVVVFDAVKFANAQRKVASAFLGGNTENAHLLLDIQDNTRETIRKIAGDGTIVLLKQAVVSTGMTEITDDVLRALKLPTDVPTMDAGNAVLDYAPTILGITPAPPGLKKAPSPGTSASATSQAVIP